MEPCDHVGFHSGRGSYDQLTEQLRYVIICDACEAEVRELERRSIAPVHAAGVARSRVESRRWTPAWRCSPRTTPSAPGHLPRWSRSAGMGRCGSRSTRTSRRAARRRTPAAASCRAATRTRYDLFVAMTAAAAATTRLRVGERHLPRHRARPDRHRQGGRERRPPLRRARRVRRRRGLEPRGDAQPRHRPEAPLQRHARARRGDEGDLDPGGGELRRRARRASTASGRGRSRPSTRTRRW